MARRAADTTWVEVMPAGLSITSQPWIGVPCRLRAIVVLGPVVALGPAGVGEQRIAQPAALQHLDQGVAHLLADPELARRRGAARAAGHRESPSPAPRERALPRRRPGVASAARRVRARPASRGTLTRLAFARRPLPRRGRGAVRTRMSIT